MRIDFRRSITLLIAAGTLFSPLAHAQVYQAIVSAGVGSFLSDSQISTSTAPAHVEVAGQLAGLSRASAGPGFAVSLESFGYATGLNQGNAASGGFNNSYVVQGNDTLQEIPVTLNFRLSGTTMAYSNGISTGGVRFGAEHYTDAAVFRQSWDTSAGMYMQGGNGFSTTSCSTCTLFETYGIGQFFSTVPTTVNIDGYLDAGLPDPIAPHADLDAELDPYIWDRLRAGGSIPRNGVSGATYESLFASSSPLAQLFTVTDNGNGGYAMAMPNTEVDVSFDGILSLTTTIRTRGQLNVGAGVDAYPAPGITYGGSTLQMYLMSITTPTALDPSLADLKMVFADGSIYSVSSSPVPLPAAVWYLLSGLGSLAMAGRRRLRMAAAA